MKKTAKVFALIVLLQFGVLRASADSPYEKAFAKAKACMDAQDFAGAEKLAKEMLALAKNPGEKTNTLIFLEDASSSNHDYVVSIQALTQVLALVKSNSQLADTCRWRRAKAYAASDHNDKALADFNLVEPGVKEPRSMVNLMRDRAITLEKLKQYDKSIADLTRAIKYVDLILGSKNDAIRISRVKGEKIALLYQRAKLFTLLGKTEAAKRDKTQADALSEDF